MMQMLVWKNTLYHGELGDFVGSQEGIKINRKMASFSSAPFHVGN